MEKVYKTPCIKSDDYREYDSQISVRLNHKYFKLIDRFNRYNHAFFIRQLIRSDLHNCLYFIFDFKDYNRVINTFNEEELRQLQEFRYREKKVHKISIKLFKEDKEAIKQRNKSITDYVEQLINNFIIKVLESSNLF